MKKRAGRLGVSRFKRLGAGYLKCLVAQKVLSVFQRGGRISLAPQVRSVARAVARLNGSFPLKTRRLGSPARSAGPTPCESGAATHFLSRKDSRPVTMETEAVFSPLITVMVGFKGCQLLGSAGLVAVSRPAATRLREPRLSVAACVPEGPNTMRPE